MTSEMIKQTLIWIISFAFLSGCTLFTPKEKAMPPAELIEFAPSASLKTLWQTNLSNSGNYAFSPSIVRNHVFVATKNEIASFDLNSGKHNWTINPEQKLSAGLGADDDHIIAGTLKGEVLAFNSEGKFLWKTQLSSEILSAPQIAEGIVVVRTSDSKIFGLDAKDGQQKWVYQRPTPSLIIRNYAGIVITRGAVFAGLPAGKLVGIDLLTGKTGWEVNVATPRGTTELERISDITSLPTLDERQICAIAYQGRVACFDLQQGHQIWAQEISSYAGLIMDHRYIYISDAKGSVMAVDKLNGKEIWKQDKLRGRNLSAPQFINRYLAVGDFQGYIHILNREDGRFVSRIGTDNSQIIVQPERLDDKILVQTKAGGLFALGIE